MRTGYDVIIVGGGTAGCVLAARLSENSSRNVCLVEAGPDYGPCDSGRWPQEMVDAHVMPTSHDWGSGGEDGRTLGARIIGGCSAHNACMVIAGMPADYDAWGGEWKYATFAPFLDRAAAMLRTEPMNTARPAPMHAAFVEAACASGYLLLADPNNPAQPVGVAPFPANVVGNVRWNTAFAYLDPARDRPNLTILGDRLVGRVVLDEARATGIVLADGKEIHADLVILSAGAYFSPAILMRSGIGPEPDLRSLGIAVSTALPVGDLLLDHCGSGLSWEPTPLLHDTTAEHERAGDLFEAHAVLKAASSACAPGTFDLHLLSWTNRCDEPGRYSASIAVFLMKPLSHGRLRLTSIDPREAPLVERGFLREGGDLAPLVEGIELARTLADTEPLRSLLGPELRPGATPLEGYLRETVRNYFHPAGTCAIGAVVDDACRVLGIDGLVVADASVMPSIPRANTNLTTVAIAERVAGMLS